MEETTDLLQHLIRNQCVNDGTPASGHEVRSVDTLAAYLQTSGVEMQRYEPSPGRGNLVLRIEGSDKSAPSLHLMGHTDVVPVTPSGWRNDPFGGELIDGEVWGRGAIDMLDVTASMAVALKKLLSSGFKPKGTLVYSAVADEESLGADGAHDAGDVRRRARSPATGRRQDDVRGDAHDALAEHRAQWHEAERHPRQRRGPGGHPHASGRRRGERPHDAPRGRRRSVEGR